MNKPNWNLFKEKEKFIDSLKFKFKACLISNSNTIAPSPSLTLSVSRPVSSHLGDMPPHTAGLPPGHCWITRAQPATQVERQWLSLHLSMHQLKGTLQTCWSYVLSAQSNHCSQVIRGLSLSSLGHMIIHPGGEEGCTAPPEWNELEGHDPKGKGSCCYLRWPWIPLPRAQKREYDDLWVIIKMQHQDVQETQVK